MNVGSPIIVEGPDGAGKTTLADKLAGWYDMEYRRPPPEVLDSTTGPGDGLVEWWDEQLAQPSSELSQIVYDRCFYISDPIYQQAQVSRSLLCDPPDLAHGIMKLWNVEPYMVFCLPPFNIQLANVNQEKRGRLEGVGAEGLLKVNNAYWACYAWASQALYDNVVKFDYTEEGAWDRLLSHLDAVA